LAGCVRSRVLVSVRKKASEILYTFQVMGRRGRPTPGSQNSRGRPAQGVSEREWEAHFPSGRLRPAYQSVCPGPPG
jgi:hypothetical protein